MKFTTVLASVQKIRREGLYDVISQKIPMSMEYRCLHYNHLVLGDTALVLAYITDFFEPYDLSNYLDAHGNSSFVKFSKSSVNLPVGFEFKVSLTLVLYSYDTSILPYKSTKSSYFNITRFSDSLLFNAANIARKNVSSSQLFDLKNEY